MLLLGPSAQLDPEKQLLTIGERTVALQRKPYLVLQYLIENRHRMILRKELLDKFWDGKEVYDQSLSKAIGSIRKAFGEIRNGSMFIETRWGLGYRYVGPFLEDRRSTPPPVSRPEFVERRGAPDNVSDPARTSNGTLVAPQQPPQRASVAAAVHVIAPAVPEAASATRQASAPIAEIQRPEIHAPSRRSLAYLFAALAVVLIIVSLWFGLRHTGQNFSARSTTTVIRSLAVLPFTAEAGQEEDQYLGLGLADAVAAKLGTVPQLSVRSSTTVRSILGVHPDPALAGKRLEVQSLVEGEVHRAEDKVTITVRLLDGASGAELWSGSYNANDSNIFATEDSIAQQVSNALLPQFGMHAVKPSPAQDTLHPQAYSKYMKAEFFASTRTQTSLAKAVDLLKEAIQIDPNYARAYAALSDCYQLQGFYEFAPPAEAYPRAKAAALKALSLDNSIAEAHVSLLSTLADYDWDWQGVEREFKAAIAVDPNYAVAYQYYGYALLAMGRGPEALAAMKHAADLDPVSPSVQASLAWAYYLLRQNEQAVDQCNRVLELYPDFVPAHQLMGIVYSQMRSDGRAITELKRAESLEKDSAITPILIDYELARSGNREAAARDLNDLANRPGGASVPDYYLAAAWTAIGDKPKAIAALNRAFQSRSNWVIYLGYDPRFDDLRPEPEFRAMLKRVAQPHDAPVQTGTQASAQ